jgi:ankyrin repeat protein
VLILSPRTRIAVLSTISTPLHIAVSRTQNYGIVRLLIENGADPGNCNASSETPLHTAFNETVRQLLLYHGDKIESDARNNRGMALLHFVTQSSKSTVDTVRRLVERGCPTDPILKDYRGRSALHLAAQRGNIAVISYLVGLGAHVDVRCRDVRGRTALHYAVESRRTEAIKVMVSLGADIRANDYGGRSILHHAAWRRNLDAVKQVVELGAAEDLLTRDIEGKTPLDLAIEEGATEIVEFLRRFMANCGMSLERPSPQGCSRPGGEGKRGAPERGANLAHPWSGGSECWALLLGWYGTAVRVIGRLGWVDLAVVLTLSCSFVFTVVLRGSEFLRECPAL